MFISLWLEQGVIFTLANSNIGIVQITLCQTGKLRASIIGVILNWTTLENTIPQMFYWVIHRTLVAFLFGLITIDRNYKIDCIIS